MTKPLAYKVGHSNCLISIAKYGSVQVKATSVVYGMSIIQYSSSGESRTGHAFYPAKMTSGSFTVGLIFTTHRGYQRMSEWLERYSRACASPHTNASPVRIIIPSRNIDKVGILKTGITYGDKVGQFTYPMTLEFVGSRNPLDLNAKNISLFRLPQSGDPSLPFFYPSSTIKGLHDEESAYNAVAQEGDFNPDESGEPDGSIPWYPNPW